MNAADLKRQLAAIKETLNMNTKGFLFCQLTNDEEVPAVPEGFRGFIFIMRAPKGGAPPRATKRMPPPDMSPERDLPPLPDGFELMMDADEEPEAKPRPRDLMRDPEWLKLLS